MSNYWECKVGVNMSSICYYPQGIQQFGAKIPTIKTRTLQSISRRLLYSVLGRYTHSFDMKKKANIHLYHENGCLCLNFADDIKF